MAIDPARFWEYDDLTAGDTVAWKEKRTDKSGIGTVLLIWLGIEEMIDLRLEDGRRITLCRGIGDEITLLEPCEAQLTVENL